MLSTTTHGLKDQPGSSFLLVRRGIATTSILRWVDLDPVSCLFCRIASALTFVLSFQPYTYLPMIDVPTSAPLSRTSCRGRHIELEVRGWTSVWMGRQALTDHPSARSISAIETFISNRGRNGHSLSICLARSLDFLLESKGKDEKMSSCHRGRDTTLGDMNDTWTYISHHLM